LFATITVSAVIGRTRTLPSSVMPGETEELL